MVLSQHVDFCMGVNIRILLIVTNFLEKWNTYNVLLKWKMTILFLTYRFKIVIFDI